MPDENSPDHTHAGHLSRLLALDGEIHASILSEAMEIAAGYLAVTDVATVLDLGAGTGAGTFALAETFPDAHVVAIDIDPDMLEGIRRRAKEQPGGDRVSTVHADVGDAGLDVGPADVAWSSNAMHEVPDPAAALRNVLRSLRRDGILLVMEMDAPPCVLPAEHAPLERALRAAAAADGPAPDWSGALVTAGFDLLETRSLTSDQRLPASGPGGAYAALELARLARHALPRLGADADGALRSIVTDLTGRHEHLDHVHVRGARTLWVARRP